MSEEELRAHSALSDLQSINPECWQNIPQPLKQAVTILTKQLRILSQAHSALHVTVTHNSESMNNRIKQNGRTITSHIDAMEKSVKRATDESEAVQRTMNSQLLLLTTTVNQQIAAETAQKSAQISSLTAEIAEISSKCTGLQNTVTAFTTDLKTAIGNIKSATRYEIEEFLLKPEFESMREDIKSVVFAYKKAEKLLNSRLDAVEIYQKTTLQAKLDKVDKAVEATLSNISETKEISANFAALIASSIESALRPVNVQAEEQRKLLDFHGIQFPKTIETLRKQVEELASAANTNREDLLMQVEEMVRREGVAVREETASVDRKLVGMIEEKERDLLSEQYAAISSLENRMIQQQETYVEYQLRDIRQKLQVSVTQWLPINLTDLKGMTPTEARLYMVEARLRSEENRRIQAVDKVYEKIGEIRKSQSREKRLRSAEWQRVSLSDTMQTPTTTVGAAVERELRTVFSPGGMPAGRPRQRRRAQNIHSGLSVQSATSTSQSVPLASPFERITVNASQKEILSIYKEFSPATYSGKSATREIRTAESDRRGTTPKPQGKSERYSGHRVSISSVISPESARSLPSSREQSPVRYVPMQQSEAVQFEGITEEL